MDFSNWTVGRKVGTGVGIIVFFIAGIGGGVAVFGLFQVSSRYVEAVKSRELVAGIRDQALEITDFLVKVEGAVAAGNASGIVLESDPYRCRFGQWLYGDGRRSLEKDFPGLGRTLQELDPVHAELHRSAAEIAGLLRSGGEDGLAKAREILARDLRPAHDRARAVLATVLEEVIGHATEAERDAATGQVVGEIGVIGVGILSVIIAILLIVILSRSISRPLREGTSVLAAATGEISATTRELALSGSQTATAVVETTTTVEELRQTAMMAQRKAGQVAEMAQKAVLASQAGRKATEDAIDGMGRIREQVESIAANVMRLSEQSQSIGEIIATVTDLADQSNLLAVNASIEAARAGEYGRGFSVVAQEIQRLAEQSKQATAQVRAILSDIQKAMTAAVLSTEQGSRAADEGMRQVERAGETIAVLSSNIGEAAQAAAQIAASSGQQLAGVEQVVQAMESIKEASQMIVDGLRKAEKAAQDLETLGAGLSGQVKAVH